MDGVMTVELKEFVAPKDRTNPNDLFGLDEVVVNGKRAGFCPHCEGALVRFVRLPSVAQAGQVRAEVARIRQEAGRWGISDKTMQPPEPDNIRSAAKKKAKVS